MLDALGQLSSAQQLLLLLVVCTLLGIGIGASVAQLQAARRHRRTYSPSGGTTGETSSRELAALRETMASEHQKLMRLEDRFRRLQSVWTTLKMQSRRQKERIAALEAALRAEEERNASRHRRPIAYPAANMRSSASPKYSTGNIDNSVKAVSGGRSGEFPVLRKRVQLVDEHS